MRGSARWRLPTLGLSVFSFSTPWIPFRLLLFGCPLCTLTSQRLCRTAFSPQSSPKFRSARVEEKNEPVWRFYAPLHGEKRGRRSVFTCWWGPSGRGTHRSSRLCEEGAGGTALRWPGGVNELGFSSPAALGATAGSVENGLSDHFDLWTYPLSDTHVPAGKWAPTFPSI